MFLLIFLTLPSLSAPALVDFVDPLIGTGGGNGNNPKPTP
jgi:hypothetical protein